MALISNTETKLKDGTEILILNPSAEDSSPLLLAMQRIIKESKHLLVQSDEFNVTVETQEKRIRDYNEHPDALYLIAKVQNQIVGALDFKVAVRRRMAHQGMFAITMLPELKGKGLGRILITKLIEWARDNSRIETLRLEVHAKNENAFALYQKLGFKIEGREIRAIKLEDGTYDDVITMALDV